MTGECVRFKIETQGTFEYNFRQKCGEKKEKDFYAREEGVSFEKLVNAIIENKRHKNRGPPVFFYSLQVPSCPDCGKIVMDHSFWVFNCMHLSFHLSLRPKAEALFVYRKVLIE